MKPKRALAVSSTRRAWRWFWHSPTGWVFCALYAALILLCFAVALSADPKGRFVIIQLPIALPMAGVIALGWERALFPYLNWITAYLVFAVPTFMSLYGLGWLLDGLRRWVQARLNR